ncbi:MAG: ATP-binding protein [Gammaproteobacteria bacterium]
MSNKMVDITLHIDEETTHRDREGFRDVLFAMPGVMGASYHDEQPHLMIIEYDPDVIVPKEFIVTAEQHGLHTELIGM